MLPLAELLNSQNFNLRAHMLSRESSLACNDKNNFSLCTFLLMSLDKNLFTQQQQDWYHVSPTKNICRFFKQDFLRI